VQALLAAAAHNIEQLVKGGRPRTASRKMASPLPPNPAYPNAVSGSC